MSLLIKTNEDIGTMPIHMFFFKSPLNFPRMNSSRHNLIGETYLILLENAIDALITESLKYHTDQDGNLLLYEEKLITLCLYEIVLLNGQRDHQI